MQITTSNSLRTISANSFITVAVFFYCSDYPNNHIIYLTWHLPTSHFLNFLIVEKPLVGRFQINVKCLSSFLYYWMHLPLVFGYFQISWCTSFYILILFGTFCFLFLSVLTFKHLFSSIFTVVYMRFSVINTAVSCFHNIYLYQIMCILNLPSKHSHLN